MEKTLKVLKTIMYIELAVLYIVGVVYLCYTFFTPFFFVLFSGLAIMVPVGIFAMIYGDDNDEPLELGDIELINNAFSITDINYRS